MPDQRQSGLLIDLRDSSAPQDSVPAGLTSVSLAEIQRQYGKEWLLAFIQGLGALNVANSGLSWWAYTSTAKNLLSSPLGNRLFEALAVLKFIEIMRFDTLFVIGATAGQQAVIEAATKRSQRDLIVRNAGMQPEFSATEIVLRLVYQAIRMVCALIGWRRHFRLPAADVFAFTYADANVSEDSDSFFGELQSLLAQREPSVTLSYIAYIQAPYRKVLPVLKGFRKNVRVPLLVCLSFGDLWWALRLSLAAFRPSQHHLSDISSISGTSLLLAEAFRWDVAKGGYFYNLLVYKAMRRFALQQAPKRLLYPFENKAIEKLLLFGVREACPTCRTIGYQHTSITPRHTTFQFAPNEAQATPLPDLVVTAGDVTRRHLEKTGNFPQDLITTGCALRQGYSRSIMTHDTADAEPIRILLALSSSKSELVKAIEFMRSVKSLSAQLEIGVRPHPEFPMSLLPEHLRTWVSAQAMDFSSTSLASNIEWCAATAYVSSTVALETLMQGKPVINLDLGEIVAPDPVLDPPPLWQRVSDPQAFIAALDSLRNTKLQKKIFDRNLTMDYVQKYFRPVTLDAVQVFLS
jgi:hypothetical protein